MKKVFRIIFFIVTLICYSSVFISPEYIWLTGFLSLLIPVILLLHFCFLIVYVRKLSKSFFYHLAIIVIGFAFIKVTYAISRNDSNGILKVLSYNVRIFSHYAHLRNEEYISSRKMIGWSVENDAQIKCFQEYYNKDKSDIFDVRKKLTKGGWDYNHSKIVHRDRSKAEFGMAIFSQLPIIKRGEIYSDSNQFMNSIYADIVKGKDTIRIYNTHLESMSIDVENVVNTDRLAKSYKDTGYRMRNGFISRAQQIKALLKSIDSCKYKMILCGDLNELPYSYPYFSLRKRLHNAFEKAGNGFEFTFNGKLFFLRIDTEYRIA
jgi:endonuclease/exonuclease/phosphatase family metal-dependent hydrolase